jgi:flagellar export protein FliJ
VANELHSLIRLHRWGVDEKRRRLAELLRVAAGLEDRGRRLEAEIKNEQAVAGASPVEVGFIYGNYAEAVIGRRQRIAGSIAGTEVEIAAAREELGDAYRELKKYEIAQDERDKRQAEELSRKEQIILDELGIKGFLQKRLVS